MIQVDLKELWARTSWLRLGRQEGCELKGKCEKEMNEGRKEGKRAEQEDYIRRKEGK